MEEMHKSSVLLMAPPPALLSSRASKSKIVIESPGDTVMVAGNVNHS